MNCHYFLVYRSSKIFIASNEQEFEINLLVFHLINISIIIFAAIDDKTLLNENI
jgi:hypothetical protein